MPCPIMPMSTKPRSLSQANVRSNIEQAFNLFDAQATVLLPTPIACKVHEPSSLLLLLLIMLQFHSLLKLVNATLIMGRPHSKQGVCQGATKRYFQKCSLGSQATYLA